jgi:uncharacterized membrane protein YraQ (UPF0718 family)
MLILGICFSAFVAAWVFLDARDRGLPTRLSVIWAICNLILPMLFLLIYVYVQQGRIPYERRPSIRQKNNVIVALLCVFGVFIVNEMILEGGGKLAPAYALFLGLFLVNVPLLLGGVLVSTIIRRWISAEAVGRRMRGGPGVFVWSILGGLVLPFGQCGAAPIARRLMLKGASPLCGMMTIGLFPVFNSVLLWRLWRGSGGPALLGAVAGFGLVSGIIMAALVSVSVERETPAEEGGFDEEDAPGLGGFCSSVVSEFIEYAKYLAVGAFLGSLIAVLVPKDSLVSWATAVPTKTASAMMTGFLSPVTYLSVPEMVGYLKSMYGNWPPLSAFAIAAVGFNVTHFAVVYGALKSRAAGLYLAIMALCVFICAVVGGVIAASGVG